MYVSQFWRIRHSCVARRMHLPVVAVEIGENKKADRQPQFHAGIASVCRLVRPIAGSVLSNKRGLLTCVLKGLYPVQHLYSMSRFHIQFYVCMMKGQFLAQIFKIKIRLGYCHLVPFHFNHPVPPAFGALMVPCDNDYSTHKPCATLWTVGNIQIHSLV